MTTFCTVCKGRLAQLSAAFPSNVEAYRGRDVEFVIIDFNSNDDLRDWIRKELTADRETGTIAYYELVERLPFHIAVGKNFAHRLASGHVVANLDGDNSVGDMLEQIESELDCQSVLHFGTGTLGDGTWGRIAMHRTTFVTLGGYDESFGPAAYHDDDLLARAGAMGFAVNRRATTATSIRNSKEDTMRFIGGGEARWWEMLRANKHRSEQNIAAGRYTANTTGFTAATFRKNFDTIVSLGRDFEPVIRRTACQVV